MRGILFDKDGTLIDFYRVWEPTIRPVILKIADDCGLPAETSFMIALEESIGVYDGKIDPEGSFAWKPFSWIAEDLYEAVCAYYEKRGRKTSILCHEDFTEQVVAYFLEEAAKIDEFPTFADLPKLFADLQRHGVEIGIATTDNTRTVLRTVRKLGIAEFISFYGTADNGMPVKPDAGLIEQAAVEWNCRPSDILVVGDTPTDMRFAMKAKATPVAVLSGTGEYEDLHKYTEKVLPSVDGLLELLHREKWIEEID